MGFKFDPELGRDVYFVGEAETTELNAKKQEAAKKFDAGKPAMSLLPAGPLLEITKVLEFGANKYGSHNWCKGMSWSRLADAALRHIFAWIWGDENDTESGLNHLAHAGCCILFLLDYILTGHGTDDRYKEAV